MGIRSFSKMIYTLLSQIALCRLSECYFFCGKHCVGRGSAVSDWSKYSVGRENVSSVVASTLSAVGVLLLLWEAL